MTEFHPVAIGNDNPELDRQDSFGSIKTSDDKHTRDIKLAEMKRKQDKNQ